jgi:ComF family protein
VSLANLTNLAFDAALALLYPQACAVCGNSVESHRDGVCCAQCWAATPLFQVNDGLCWKCGALARGPVAVNERERVRCGQCDDDDFTLARACGAYEGALRASIIELKRRPHAAPRLVRQLHQVQQSAPLSAAEIIIPVPLHPVRERERGFNQAVILARELARLSGLPLDEHSLVRRSQTKMHRAGMDRKARRKSVAGAFSVRHGDLITGKKVLLIDDVFTTGATASACAKALKDDGASEVFVLTICRA